MDAILTALNAFRQSTVFTALQPFFLSLAVTLPLLMALAVVERDAVIKAVRDALRHAGITDKEVGYHFGQISKGLVSHLLNGERPMTLDRLALLPAEFWQWFAVELAGLVDVPATVQVGARLKRRQLRMDMHKHKEGVA